MLFVMLGGILKNIEGGNVMRRRSYGRRRGRARRRSFSKVRPWRAGRRF